MLSWKPLMLPLEKAFLKKHSERFGEEFEDRFHDGFDEVAMQTSCSARSGAVITCRKNYKGKY